MPSANSGSDSSNIVPGTIPLPTSERKSSEDLRAIEQPQRLLARWLRKSFDAAAGSKPSLKPGGRVVIAKSGV